MSCATPSSSPPTTPISTSSTIFAAAAFSRSSSAISQVLVEVDRRAVPHVRLEQRLLAGVHAVLRERDQRADVAVQLVLGAVVGVQRDVHRVLLGDDVRELGQRDRAGDHVLDLGAGAELRAAGRELDDPVAPGVGEAAQGGVHRLRGRAVDRRIGEPALLRPADHVGVDLGGRDGHAGHSCRRCPAVGALLVVSIAPRPSLRGVGADAESQGGHEHDRLGDVDLRAGQVDVARVDGGEVRAAQVGAAEIRVVQPGRRTGPARAGWPRRRARR